MHLGLLPPIDFRVVPIEYLTGILVISPSPEIDVVSIGDYGVSVALEGYVGQLRPCPNLTLPSLLLWHFPISDRLGKRQEPPAIIH